MTHRTPPFILLAAILTVSCTGSPTVPDPDDSENARVDRWVYEQLDRIYYWQPRLPRRDDTDLELAPEGYLNSVMAPDDRFSYLEPAEAATRATADGYVTDLGINYIVWLFSDGRRMLQITSVVPGSPAAAAGLRRSDLVGRVGGFEIPASGVAALLAPDRVILTLCDPDFAPLREVSLAKAPYYDTPVMLDTVYTVGALKVGYLAYSKFYSAADDDNATDLVAAFRRMKAAGATELILDLRYNGGGYETLFVKMASLIAPASKVAAGDILAYRTDREGRTVASGVDRFALTPEELAAANLDLARVIVLANGHTASASEVTMHTLARHIPVIHYGAATVGKYVGSYPISGEAEGIPWTLHAISSRLWDNRFLGDPGYPNGLAPNVAMHDNGLPYSAGNGPFFGDPGDWDDADGDYDPVLRRVMTDLVGATRAATPRESRPTPRAEAVSTIRPRLILNQP